MKLAVVDHVGNKGGLSRVIIKLLPQLSDIDKNIKITYFGSISSIRRENLVNEFKNSNISIKYLDSLKYNIDYTEKNFLKKLFSFAQKNLFNKFSFLPYSLSGNLNNELKNKLNKFELIYFPWPFLIDFPEINVPVIATFHDFNFKYYFSGTTTYSYSQMKLMNKQMSNWMNNSRIIVSNKFTASELLKFYPNVKKKVNVIPLGPYSNIDNSNNKNFEEIRTKFNLPKKYIFCGTNTCAHKNLNPLFAALHLLKKEEIFINLILTGPGTEVINGKSSEYGVELTYENREIFGLGYVKNNELDQIIKNCDILISPEMYTSDNGPATDGWANGIPTILADIPSNREHIETQSVYSELFDYRDPEDIAKKIKLVMNNKKKYLDFAEKSKQAINKISWKNVAEEYYKTFNEAI